MVQPLIDLQNVRLTLTSRAGPVDILRGVDLKIGRGQSVAILGSLGFGQNLAADGAGWPGARHERRRPCRRA